MAGGDATFGFVFFLFDCSFATFKLNLYFSHGPPQHCSPDQKVVPGLIDFSPNTKRRSFRRCVANELRVCCMCRRHCSHSVLKYGNKHTTIHGRIGSVARLAPPSREDGVQSPVGAELLVLFFFVLLSVCYI
jgi:hypothetical protein